MSSAADKNAHDETPKTKAAAEPSENGEQVADALFSPYEHFSGITLKNRVVMAPMTRGRSGHDRIPNDMMLEYYVSRTSAGLIITEGTSFSDTANGWAQTAAIETDEQVAGWKKITDAVHEKGGLMSVQLWHTGRASHHSFREDGSPPVAPSAIAISGHTHDKYDKKVPYDTPRALEVSEMPGIVESYIKAAQNAEKAGFDFIEIHSANGYLLDSFLQSCSNKRTDEFGGSFENRFRLVREVIEGILTVFPADRLGIRFSPNGAFQDMGSPDNIEAYTYYIKELNAYKLGWLEVMDGLSFGFHKLTRPFTLCDARKVYDYPLMGNVGYTRDTADTVIRCGAADAISFGRLFISNPDLVDKFQHDIATSSDVGPDLYYTHGPEGYIGVPTAKQQ